MPLQATSGAASYDAFGGGVPVIPNYIEDVFNVWVYPGSNSATSINNGIDLAGKGGLVWTKGRTGSADNHLLIDTVRGVNKPLRSNENGGQYTETTLTAFNSNGYNITGGNGDINLLNRNYVSWTFREQPKFFDVVTYTGDGTSPRSIAHNLGSTAACVMVKRTDTTGNWKVLFTGLTRLCLNSTEAEMGTLTVQGGYIDNANTTTFTLVSNAGSVAEVNASGGTYVAYVFASNAGGFGLTGTDNVISCGSFTQTAGITTTTLGYEPQYLLLKSSSGAGDWRVVDNMRNFSATGFNSLSPNTSGAESGPFAGWSPTATGFTTSTETFFSTGTTYIYIAIRRGPMKVPTTGTSVFSTSTSSSTTANITSGFVTDLAFTFDRSVGSSPFNRGVVDRLRGNFLNLSTAITNAETSNTSTVSFQQNNGIQLNGGTVYANGYVYEQFQRAPGFFDVVCYTGTGSARTVTHNLAVVPELIIVKSRSDTSGWRVYSAALGAGYLLQLSSTAAAFDDSPSYTTWNNTTPTSSVFSVGAASAVNGSGTNYVAYLFASCPGVSKVGSYTGTGSTQTINCGFTGGARFVLIKSTSTTGNWLVWDSARGIVAGNDPYLALNSTAAEVTNTDWVDTAATGFELSNAGGNLANSNGVSYIFLAIA